MDGRIDGCRHMETQGRWGSRNSDHFTDVIYLRSLAKKFVEGVFQVFHRNFLIIDHFLLATTELPRTEDDKAVCENPQPFYVPKDVVTFHCIVGYEFSNRKENVSSELHENQDWHPALIPECVPGKNHTSLISTLDDFLI